MKPIIVVWMLLMLVSLTGCATIPNDPALLTFDQSRLPPADISLTIPGLGPCTNNPDRTLHLNSQQPVTVLVHGCRGSTGNFRALAEVLAFHGQQTACFTYNDRASLMVSSGQLADSLDTLTAKLSNKEVTVIGHSQGALIARKALVAESPDPMRNSAAKLRLVTISGPFSGIASAKQCGTPSRWTKVWTLGLIEQLCQVVSGDKWFEITSASDFIRQPGKLLGQVQTHIKIDTDERGTCRRFDNSGVCVESDYVFSLDEQINVRVDETTGLKKVEVRAGHVEIVGDQRVAPVKLIAVLQQYGILNRTEEKRSAAFSRLLARLYE